MGWLMECYAHLCNVLASGGIVCKASDVTGLGKTDFT